MNNLSLKFRLEVMTYKLSRNFKDLKYKIKYSRYNLYNYIKYLYRKHDIYNKIISSKYNVIHRFLVYLEFKGIINNNQINNNNKIWIKKVGSINKNSCYYLFWYN